MIRTSYRARDFITDLAAEGRHHFTTEEVRQRLGVSSAAARLALHRLGRNGLIASPGRGFYVILPPEYRRLGCLPAEQFVPALVRDQPHYAALLSAAEYHGAAHHRPQAFQVALRRNRRPISCGAVSVRFIARRRIDQVPVERFNTARGTILVSSPEATAVDLVGYPDRAGGLDQVATVLSELAERIHPERLVTAAETAPVSWAQRLGYLLEETGAADRTSALKAYVRERANHEIRLVPNASDSGAARAPDWRLLANAVIEAEA